MTIIDVGSGAPLVLVPGVQGRWEWMRPAVDALSRRCRVITFSLADEPTCGGNVDSDRGFACYVDQIVEAMDRSGLERAAVCGVSYGGLIAAAFAARHPERVASLVLVSAIPPTWAPDARARFFLRAPWLLSPLFLLQSLRLYGEIAAAAGVVRGLGVAAGHTWRIVRHSTSPGRMARRVRWLQEVSLRDELVRVKMPVLVVTGESALDRVVPVSRTHEYLRIWPQARAATIARTGHLGLVTRPDAFAEVVGAFVDETSATGRVVSAPSERRRIG